MQQELRKKGNATVYEASCLARMYTGYSNNDGDRPLQRLRVDRVFPLGGDPAIAERAPPLRVRH
jgi:hypothetical protein